MNLLRPAVDGGMLIPAVGYVRVSTWNEEKISPELQRAAIMEWARRRGRVIVDWIEDLDASGRNFKRKIMQAIGAVEQGKAREIAVWKYSRFGRTRHGNAVNIERVERAGGQLESATEEVDARTATGRFQRGVLLEVAAFESDRAGEQWRETHDHRRALGLPATGRQRFGYHWHPRRIPDGIGGWTIQQEWYEPIRDHRPVVRNMFRTYTARDMGYPGVAGWLNECGYMTSWGGPWTGQAVNGYMISGFAAGLLRVHSKECTCGKRSGTCPNHYYMPGAHEAMLLDGEWEEYLATVKEVRRIAPRARRGSYPLSALSKCGNCRQGATASPYRGMRGGVYRCSYNSKSAGSLCPGIWILRPVVEAQVVEWLGTVAANVDSAPAAPIESVEARQVRKSTEQKLKEAQATRKRAQDALTRLTVDHALSPENYPGDTYAHALAKLKKKHAEADAVVSKLEPNVEVLPSADELRPIAVGLLAEWKTLTAKEQNKLMHKLARRVEIRREPDRSITVTVHPVWEPDAWAESKAA
ncbi:recombinase family protein [Embleya sp. MST-111070]|uniref:recombinase family protein n=1 Tax=Embleya sp. MST-111070 TaxID=3398231 RepID=UPI003F734163